MSSPDGETKSTGGGRSGALTVDIRRDNNGDDSNGDDKHNGDDKNGDDNNGDDSSPAIEEDIVFSPLRTSPRSPIRSHNRSESTLTRSS